MIEILNLLNDLTSEMDWRIIRIEENLSEGII
jgi:hypothetical protein